MSKQSSTDTRCITSVMEKTNKMGIEIYLAFLDIVPAFDNAPKKEILKLVEITGTSNNSLDLFKVYIKMYREK